MSLLDLTDEIILITGGCGAIGQVVVRTLAEYGARVAVNDIVPETDAAQIFASMNVAASHVAYFQADVTQPEAVDIMLKRVVEHWEFPTIVCCHTGMVEAHSVDQYPLDVFDKLLNLNLRSTFILAQAAARYWMQKKLPGHLIFTSSWVQDVPWPEIMPYSVSKSGMRTMMRGFARELAPYNIRANAIAPGIVGVGMAKRQWDTEPPYRTRAEKAIPLGYMQPPETVANGFLFLCSTMASYMTGSVLLMDGGCSLYPMD